MKEKVLKIILTVVLICLIIFGIILTRKYLIIRKIENNLAKYNESKNYYVEQILTNNSDYSRKSYRLNNKELAKLNGKGDYEVEIFKDFSTGKENKYITSQNGDKIAQIGENISSESSNYYFENPFKTISKWNFLKVLIKAKISSKEYNSKDCYYIDLSDCIGYLENIGNLLLDEDEPEVKYELYFEKDTSLIIYNPELKEEYKYEFNTVTEDDLKEPDISDYSVLE